MKTLFTVIFTFLLFGKAHAQKDTLIYYMRAGAENYDVDHFNYTMLTDSSNAEFIRFVISPTEKNDTLYLIKDYDFHGKLMLMAQSTKRAPNAIFEGVCIAYFANGHKKTICNYHNGKIVGDIISYFPNGHPNTVRGFKNVDITESRVDANVPYLKQCLDSVGNVLVSNGNGKWVEYRNDYKIPFAEGVVNNGVEDGEWRGRLNDTLNYVCNYLKGQVTSGKSISVSGKEYPFTKVFTPPDFSGGMENFGNYLGRSLRFPPAAIENHEEGIVISSFLVERNGQLSSIQAVKSPYRDLADEAVRVLEVSPYWIPAYLYGLPAKVYYSVPISFTQDPRTDGHMDIIVTYMKNNVDLFGNIVAVVTPKDSAEFIRRIMSPNRNKNEKMFSVRDVYLNGKTKLIGVSTSGSTDLRLDGYCAEFYPNGNKKATSNYNFGRLVGKIERYYYNGKIYISGFYNDGKLLLQTCVDSTGKVLAKKGDGTWIKYSDDFKRVIEQGPVKDGMEEGM